MFTKLHIWWLKRQTRKVMHEINTIYDRYDCGNAFAAVLAGYRIEALEDRKRTIINKLRAIDPKFPKAKP